MEKEIVQKPVVLSSKRKTATWSGLNRLARKLEFILSVANQQQQQ